MLLTSNTLFYGIVLLTSLVTGTSSAAVDPEVLERGLTTSSDNEEHLLSTRQALSTSYTNYAEFKKQQLAAHNFFRRQHGASSLTWNDNRAIASERWAKRCQFKHSGQAGVGENIAIGFGSVKDTVNAWGLERKSYNFNNPGFNSATGHFTQMVWKGTNQVGCGRVKCPNGVFVVCQYHAQGNIVNPGQFAANVGRQSSGSPGTGWDGRTAAKKTRSIDSNATELLESDEVNFPITSRKTSGTDSAHGANSITAVFALIMALVAAGLIH